MAQKTVLGVLGGSGFYDMPGAKVIKSHRIETPYGLPSDEIVEAELGGRQVYFLPRHGKGHRLTPTEVPYRANIYALKTLGVTHLLAVSAVGIMTESIRPGDMVIPDQIFDRTKGVRASTFFGDGVVGHVAFADPFSTEMRQFISKAAQAADCRLHEGGTYVCMEGPQFSTRAESHFYRQTLSPAVIGMTAIPEAKLAREAEMCYGMLALATDYDCWHEEEEDVNVESVLQVMRENTQTAQGIVLAIAEGLPESSSSPDLETARHAILTDINLIPEAKKQELAPLYGKYFNT